MSNTHLWGAVYDQATVWSRTPVFERFASNLPANAPGRLTGVQEALQNLNAAGARIDAKPLRAFSFITLMLGQVPAPVAPSEDLAAWLPDARSVEAAHREFIAWLRSRLPNYPMLRVPQVTRDTPLTTSEFTWRLSWRRADFSNGLQFLSTPRNVTGLLGASEEQGKDLDRTTRAVSAAFARTDEWQNFVETAAVLEASDWEELAAASKTLRLEIKPELIDAYEPHVAVRRNEFRESAMAAALDALSGIAKEYAEAFAAVDALIETAASNVFGQIAAYGSPTVFEQVSEIDIESGVSPRVHFTLNDVSFPKLGMLAFVKDEMVMDAMFLGTITLSHYEGSGTSFRVTGDMLKGSGAAWRNRI